jgi:predicted permease
MSLRSLRLGLRRLFNQERAERDLADEVEHFLQMAVADQVRRGVSPADAERRARLQCGGVESVKETVRSAGWEARVDAFWRDLRYARRGLRRQPAFTLAATGTLALGIGATTAMFSVINGVMLRPLPFPRAHELAVLWTDDVRRGLHREATSYPTIRDWQQYNQTFADLAFYSSERATFLTRDGRQRTRLVFTSPNLFAVLEVTPQLGRWLTASDMQASAPVGVISHALWQRQFGGDPAVLGKALALDDWQGKGTPPVFHIVGVMPPDFAFPDRLTDVWTPASTYWRWDRERSERFPSWARRWSAIGRLDGGVSIAEAREDFTRVASYLTNVHGADVADFPGFAVAIVPMLETVAGQTLQRSLWLLLGAVIVVLLVACANVGNLLIARGMSREHELAVRYALGASRGRVLSQLLAEALMIAALGGTAGVLIAFGVTRVLSTLPASGLPRLDEISVDTTVLVFAVLVSLAAGVMFGLLPAARAVDHRGALSLHGFAAAGAIRRRGIRSALVTAECALAVVLLVGAGLLLRSLAHVRGVEAGFDGGNVLVARVEFGRETPGTVSEDAANRAAPALARVQALDDLLATLVARDDVDSAALIDDLFITSDGNESIVFPGRDPGTIAAGHLTAGAVSPEFFSTLRVPLRQGRYLTRADTLTKIRALWTNVDRSLPLVEIARRAVAEPVVVNEAFVQRFLPDTSPIAQRFCVDASNKPYCYEIVGVVANMHRQGPEQIPAPEYYGPFLPHASSRADLLIRTRAEPSALAADVRRMVTDRFAGTVVPRVATVTSDFGAFTAQRNFHTWLLTIFALLALTLAAIGIFGVVHYSVTQRMRELAVRVSIGARPRDVLMLVIVSGLRAPVIGLAAGVVIALAAGRMLSHLMFGVETSDIVTFVAVAITLGSVAFAACYVPAHRAARRDALSVLRLE